MITENENKAIQLAKKVFEHFTHDSLPIAREIIAMEHDLGLTPINGKPVNGANDNSTLPVQQLNEELVHKPEDDLPF